MCSILRKLKHPWKADEISLMMKNGGILLEKLIESSKGKYNPIRSFSIEEIKTATNDFNIQNLVVKLYYEVYKGFLHDRPVSVLKYSGNGAWAKEYGFNNIVFAAQMCHKNTLKLIGCCLETQTPILVFESVKYGCLADRICHGGQPDFEPLLWTHRLKIAMEIADVVAYFHVGFSRPIVFRRICPFNIFFNEEHIPKLLDFSGCISIPEDKTYIDTAVMGTLGYMAPEYYTSGHCNEKCDVFSFGGLLLALFRGSAYPYFSSATDDQVENFLGHVQKHNENNWLKDKADLLQQVDVQKHIENNRWKDIVDPIIVGDGLSHEKEQQLQSFLDLAIKCYSASPENRPTMVDVAKQIRQLFFSCNSC